MYSQCKWRHLIQEDIKDRRLTFYMNEEEESRLNSVAEYLELDKTNIVAMMPWRNS